MFIKGATALFLDLQQVTMRKFRLLRIATIAAGCILSAHTVNAQSFAVTGQETVNPEAFPFDCTFTQGYWKNHAEAWPVDGIDLGNRFYTKAELLDILALEVDGNGLVSLAHQLTATKLNIVYGADDSCVDDAVIDADSLIGDKIVPPVGSGFIHPSESSALSTILDQFNMGNSQCGQCQQPTNVVVVKTAPAGPVAVGANFQYMISACNNSQVSANDVVVTDTLPACASFVSAAPAPLDVNANPLRWNLGTLAPGQCRSIVINVTAECHTDDCVNTATVSTIDPETDYDDNVDTATASVVDNDPPDIDCPPDVTIECPATASGMHPDITGYATATDNCDVDDISYSDVSEELCGDTRVTTRTWTARDTSGNTDSCQQVITVVDTTAPSLTCPGDINIDGPIGSDTCVVVNYPAATFSDTCGDVTVTYSPPSGTCFPCGTVTTVNVTATDECGNVHRCSFTVTVGPCPDNGCSLTQGYWKNHPENWPVDSLFLGNQANTYNKAQLLAILNQPVRGNGLVALAHQLIAAKLNVANDADGSCIASTIAAADALIGSKRIPPHSTKSVSANAVSALVSSLDDYNNGLLCVPHCDDLEAPIQLATSSNEAASLTKQQLKAAKKAAKQAANAAKKAAKKAAKEAKEATKRRTN
jgi:uncharacterized repeat protein (TIGR01451 family)